MQHKSAKAAQGQFNAAQVSEGSTSRRWHKLAQAAQRRLNTAQINESSSMMAQYNTSWFR
jgi:hypothetical protein